MYSLYLTKLIELYKQARNIKTFNYYDSYQYKNFNEWLNNLKLCEKLVKVKMIHLLILKIQHY